MAGAAGAGRWRPGLAYEQVGQPTPYVLTALLMAVTSTLMVRDQPGRSTTPYPAGS